MSAEFLAEYYASILPDPKGLVALGNTPLPTTLWANSLKLSAARLAELLEESGYVLTPIPWHGSAFRVSQGEIGKSWQYQAGFFQIQEEVSMLPGVLLQPQPHEKILDLCAAPGNKTAQLAVGLKNTGTLVANDRNYGRMRALGQTMKRLSLLNISTTIYDGRQFPECENYFDKVLVDAPCSCEGTYRKGVDKSKLPNQSHSIQLGKLQFSLLKKAIKLVRKGGRVLYSTCTFAPEENEAVISKILQEFGDALEVVPISVPFFKTCPGVLQWQNKHYHPEVEKCVRIWPHLNDTGGFFIALLEKKAGASSQSSVKRRVVDQERLVQSHTELNQRFGLEASVWAQYQFVTSSKRGLYLTCKDHQLPEAITPDAVGMFYLKTRTNYPKLTTAAASLFGSLATKNSVSLTRVQLQCYIEKGENELTQAQCRQLTGTGFVLVKYEEFVLGTGLYLSAYQGKPPRLQSLFPKYLPD